uniref:Neurogenic mastermind-like N-terminal domain-containing protein n=3 Tax=Ciona intestinalis TaxID=7719 RepID=F6TYJ4_CIOIN
MQSVSMSSGDCANYPHNRHLLLNRLRRRVENCKQHTQDCQVRQHNTQHMRAEVDRMNTAMLMQKVQENKLKKTGKYKNDSVRPKPSIEQGNDTSDIALNKLKRKLESSNLCNNGALIKQGNLMNGCDPNMTSGGNGLPSFMTNQQFDMNQESETQSKKMKLDSEQQQQQQQQQHYHANQANTNQPGNNNCNNGNVSSLSVQIVQQFNNEKQRRIETTVNVNTSNNGMGNGDSTQSVSVNVGPKDIKQEMNQDSTQATHSTVVNSNVTQSSQEQTDDGMQDTELGGITDLINDSDFESWLDEFSQNPTGEDGLGDFGITTADTQQQQQQQQQQHLQQQQQQQQQNQPQQGQSMGQQNVLKDNQFQCKTEKVDFHGFIGEGNNNNNTPNNQPQFFNTASDNHTNQMFNNNNQAPNFGDKTSSPFTHSTMTQQNINMNQQHNMNATNDQMTSQHIQRLSVSVNSKFSVMQKQQQQHPGMNNTRSPSNEHEVMRTTPEGPPRLSHPPSANMAKSVSPSPVSYSVTHQPHPGLNSMPNGQASGPFFGGSVQQNPPNPMTGGMGQTPNMQRAPRMPMQGNNFGSLQRGGNTGMPMSSGMNNGLGPSPVNQTGMSKAQQLKELAEKRIPSGMNNQWSASASASVNMSSSLAFNGPSMNQRDHMTADMQSFSSFQTSGVNNGNQPQVNVQPNNYMAASVAAQAAVAASHRQQQHAPYNQGSRLSHYNTMDGNFQSNQSIPDPRMTAKSMFPNAGTPMNPSQIQASKNRYMQRNQPQQIMRGIRGPGTDMVAQERPAGMPAYYGRQMEQKYGSTVPQGGQMMNGSASVNMRIQQSAAITTNQRHMQVQ